MFYVGQKVVCVDGKPRNYPHCAVRAGAVYTVSKIMHSIYGDSLHVAEVDGDYWGFYADRFRPVVERKTDISIFTAMLNPSKQRVEA